MIKTEQLTKVYTSGTKAIDGVTFSVAEGEIFGFLGSNGAGKSTTIKILTTLSRPTAGNAWVNGHDLTKDPVSVRKSIGYVAQESGVDYFMTGRENLVLQGRLYRMPGETIRKRADELLSLFDLSKEADQLVSTYSGGMRRKLDIATALIHQPKIIFLDEPTLGLDPHSRTNLWDYIRALNRDLKVTIFLTTHYLDEADRLSHRIGILHKGSIKVVNTPDALKNSIHGDSLNLSFEKGMKEKAESVLKTHPLVKEILSEPDHLRVYVDRGSEAIPVLMTALGKEGVPVSTVTLARPSLDDVYLKYSGVSYKEDGGGEEANPWWAKWAGKGGGGWWKGDKGEEAGETEASSAQDGQQSGEADSGNKDWEAEWKKWNPGSTATPEEDWKKWQAKASPETAAEPAAEPAVESREDWKKWQTPASAPEPAAEVEEDWKKWQGQAAAAESSAKPEEDWRKWQTGSGSAESDKTEAVEAVEGAEKESPKPEEDWMKWQKKSAESDGEEKKAEWSQWQGQQWGGKKG